MKWYRKKLLGFIQAGVVEIYDYKQHPGEYSFRDLQELVAGLPETHIFIIANFHLAVQSDENLKHLNFSRDMIEKLVKKFYISCYTICGWQISNWSI